MSNNRKKKWLEASLQKGSIYCCPVGDLSLENKPIASGAWGVIYKAMVNFNSTFGEKQGIPSGRTVAVKTFSLHVYKSEDDFYRQFVREVICYAIIITAY